HIPGDGAEDGQSFTHVYAIGRVKGADMAVIEVWTRAKVNKHLKQYNKVGTRHYALANENNFEMYARKVALLQVLKYMPASVEMSNALEVSHASESGRGAVIDGDIVRVDDEPSENESHASLDAVQSDRADHRAADMELAAAERSAS
ncbi:MAG: recombinase RecT, partial [Burkholderiaceae bacterium]